MAGLRQRSACAPAMARTAVALLLLGLAYAHAQTYVLDTQQQQKVWLRVLRAMCHTAAYAA